MIVRDPIGNGLMMRLEEAPKAPQPSPFQIECQGLRAFCFVIAAPMWLRRPIMTTAFTLKALTATRVESGFDQGIRLTVGARVHHKILFHLFEFRQSRIGETCQFSISKRFTSNTELTFQRVEDITRTEMRGRTFGFCVFSDSQS